MTSVSRGNGCHNILRTAGKRYTEIAYMRIFWYSMGVELASVRDSSCQVIMLMINYPSRLISVSQTRRRLVGIFVCHFYDIFTTT
jgi:hypothetical protein